MDYSHGAQRTLDGYSYQSCYCGTLVRGSIRTSSSAWSCASSAMLREPGSRCARSINSCTYCSMASRLRTTLTSTETTVASSTASSASSSPGWMTSAKPRACIRCGEEGVLASRRLCPFCKRENYLHSQRTYNRTRPRGAFPPLKGRWTNPPGFAESMVRCFCDREVRSAGLLSHCGKSHGMTRRELRNAHPRVEARASVQIPSKRQKLGLRRAPYASAYSAMAT
jgi:hypothetical protein